MEETCWQPSQTHWLSAPRRTRPLQQRWLCRVSTSYAELRFEIQLLSYPSLTSGLMANLRQLPSGGSGQQILARIRIKHGDGSFSYCAELSRHKAPEDLHTHCRLTHFCSLFKKQHPSNSTVPFSTSAFTFYSFYFIPSLIFLIIYFYTALWILSHLKLCCINKRALYFGRSLMPMSNTDPNFWWEIQEWTNNKFNNYSVGWEEAQILVAQKLARLKKKSGR